MVTRPSSIAQLKFDAVSADVAHAGSRCPLVKAFHTLSTFLCLPLEFLHESVESDVGHFASPETFHTIKVQRFKEQHVEPTDQFKGEFPMVVFALPLNLAVLAGMMLTRTFAIVATTLFRR